VCYITHFVAALEAKAAKLASHVKAGKARKALMLLWADKRSEMNY